MNKIYQVCENNTVVFEYEIFDIAYHEMLSYILNNNNKYSNNTYLIKEKLFIPNKKYDIITNIFNFNSESNNFCIESQEKSNITINIIKPQIINLIDEISNLKIIVTKKNKIRNNIIIKDDSNEIKTDLIIDDHDNINNNILSKGKMEKNNEANNGVNCEINKKEKLKQMQEMIKKMEYIKNKKLEILEEKRLKNEEEKERITEENLKIQKKKLYERTCKDKIKELKNIYNSDISVYCKIKDEIENNSEAQPPLLLRAKYPILKFIDENNLLNHEHSYIIFKKIYYMFYEKDSEARKYYGNDVFELSEEEENIYVNNFYEIDDKINEFIDYLSSKIIDVEKLIDHKFSGDTIKNSISFN